MGSPPEVVDQDRLAALVTGARTGDAIAWGDLIELLTPLVRKWCGPIALSDGADATQETLIVVVRTLHQLRDPAALFGWVRTIAVREAVRIARKRHVGVELTELTELPASGDPLLLVDVLAVLRRLAPEHRAILMLRDMEGFDEQRAANMLSIPVGTAKSRLSRARGSFLKEWGHD